LAHISAHKSGNRSRSGGFKTPPLVTEHHIDGDHRIVIAINYSPERVDEQLTLAEGWSLGEFHRGRPTLEGVVLRVEISPNDALVFQVNR